MIKDVQKTGLAGEESENGCDCRKAYRGISLSAENGSFWASSRSLGQMGTEDRLQKQEKDR